MLLGSLCQNAFIFLTSNTCINTWYFPPPYSPFDALNTINPHLTLCLQE
jgi:hypothetical protein